MSLLSKLNYKKKGLVDSDYSLKLKDKKKGLVDSDYRSTLKNLKQNIFNNPKKSHQLVYPINTKTYTTVLLIENTVKKSTIFYDSVNETTFPIIYSSTSTKNEIIALLKTKFTIIDRIGIVFVSNLTTNSTNLFLDNQPFFIENESLTGAGPYSENMNFIIEIINSFSVKHIDYLGCNTLNYANWVNYYNSLNKKTNVIIGASNDKTGNIKYGGDWVMETTSENIESIYFTNSIKYYKYLLDNEYIVSTPLDESLIKFFYIYNDHIYVLWYNNIQLNYFISRHNLINGTDTWLFIDFTPLTEYILMSGELIDFATFVIYQDNLYFAGIDAMFGNPIILKININVPLAEQLGSEDLFFFINDNEYFIEQTFIFKLVIHENSLYVDYIISLDVSEENTSLIPLIFKINLDDEHTLPINASYELVSSLSGDISLYLSWGGLDLFTYLLEESGIYEVETYPFADLIFHADNAYITLGNRIIKLYLLNGNIEMDQIELDWFYSSIDFLGIVENYFLYVFVGCRYVLSGDYIYMYSTLFSKLIIISLLNGSIVTTIDLPFTASDDLIFFVSNMIVYENQLYLGAVDFTLPYNGVIQRDLFQIPDPGPDPGPDPEPDPEPTNGLPKYCKCPVYRSGNLPFNGNTNNSTLTNAMRYSQLVRYRGKYFGRSRIIGTETDINAFGYRAGGPNGFGAPPRNSF